jgi:hypothetical protein
VTERTGGDGLPGDRLPFGFKPRAKGWTHDDRRPKFGCCTDYPMGVASVTDRRALSGPVVNVRCLRCDKRSSLLAICFVVDGVSFVFPWVFRPGNTRPGLHEATPATLARTRDRQQRSDALTRSEWPLARSPQQQRVMARALAVRQRVLSGSGRPWQFSAEPLACSAPGPVRFQCRRGHRSRPVEPATLYRWVEQAAANGDRAIWL